MVLLVNSIPASSTTASTHSISNGIINSIPASFKKSKTFYICVDTILAIV
jgi:hypothetical protein